MTKTASSMSGKRVLITGASKGIGAAAARVFAQAGAKLGLMARSSATVEGLAAELIAEFGANTLAIPGDVARFGDLETAALTMKDRFRGIDVLINNAGVIAPIGRLDQIDPAAWRNMTDINLTGVFNGIRAVLPGMVAQGGGTVLTVSSGAASNPLEGWSHYCSSKAGAAMLTRCLDLESRDKGIRAMGLSPGTVATDMQVEIKASGINPISQLDPSVHIPADWPAKALLWMCSPDADAFIGQEVSLRDPAIRARVGLSAA